MPRDEGLRKPDLGDELGDGRLGDGEGAHDPEAIDVGEGLVDEAQFAQLVRLEDGAGDRAPNAGGRWAQRGFSGCAVASTTVYINRG